MSESSSPRSSGRPTARWLLWFLTEPTGRGQVRWAGLTTKGGVPVWTWHPIPTACWRTWSRGVMKAAFPVLGVNVASGRVRHNTVYLHSGKQVPATHQAEEDPGQRGGQSRRGGVDWWLAGGLARGLPRCVSLDCVEDGVVSQERKDGRRGRFGEVMKV